MNWIYLISASVFSAIAVIFLRLSEGFTKKYPSILTFSFISLDLVCLSLALKTIDMGVAYTVWSGLGTVLAVAIGIILFAESANLIKILSIISIVLGVAVLKIA